MAEEIASTAWLSDRSEAVCGLAECALAEGDTARAVKLAEEALQDANRIGAKLLAIPAALTLAASLRASGAAAGRLEEVLDRAEASIRDTGAVAYEGRLLEERGEADRHAAEG